MAPTPTATLGVKGHRPVVGTWDRKHLLYVFAVVNLVTAAAHANALGSPKDAKKTTGQSTTRRRQEAFAAHLRHIARTDPAVRHKRVVILIGNAPWHRGKPIDEALRDHPHPEFKRLPGVQPAAQPDRAVLGGAPTASDPQPPVRRSHRPEIPDPERPPLLPDHEVPGQDPASGPTKKTDTINRIVNQAARIGGGGFHPNLVYRGGGNAAGCSPRGTCLPSTSTNHAFLSVRNHGLRGRAMKNFSQVKREPPGLRRVPCREFPARFSTNVAGNPKPLQNRGF